jgi:hypothetical protein
MRYKGLFIGVGNRIAARLSLNMARSTCVLKTLFEHINTILGESQTPPLMLDFPTH